MKLARQTMLLLFAVMFLTLGNAFCQPQPLFFEAEDFQVQGNGWEVAKNPQTCRASLAVALNGANGKGDSLATQTVEIPQTGTWRVWVRYMVHRSWRGPFDVDVLEGNTVVASKTFDQEYAPGTEDWDYRWESLDASLKQGRYILRLRKHQQKNSSGYVRNVDCFLLTTDLAQQPDHLLFGPQTWMRVTLGDVYEKPVQIHIFADHFRSPWYAHYAVSKDGVEAGLNPKRKEALLANGETTGWVNITRMVYQDSGALLSVYPAYRYGDNAKRFVGTVEFANNPQDTALVRKIEVDYTPSTLNVILPPNLETQENIARLRSDADISAHYGQIADGYKWPKVGKRPVKFPFFIASGLNPKDIDTPIIDRELKTLAPFGFNGLGSDNFFGKYGYRHKYIGGPGWLTKGSYSSPDTEKIRERGAALYKSQIASGIKPEEIAYAMVMDEPQGEPAARLAKDAASIEGFRNWLKGKNLTPTDLLVSSWDEVKPVIEAERNQFPALHYYTQQYRTVALGNFIALQKQILHENWQKDFPVNVNFSDGAIYFGNFYGQGVDYFTLLHETDQNAIWGEDWSNGASTYQNATFNVELMRAAARKHNQHIGHYLIAYAGRKGYDIRLKAISEAARGVKAFKSFAYGPEWTTHENSPWQKVTSLWGDHAALIHEIGAVEDVLTPAMPQKAEVALLYSSAADAWNYQGNLASGFERMHTWLALTHAQIPVDVVHESEVAEGVLGSGYKVCYLADTHITRAAADKLSKWVEDGGTLILSAGAGQRDEFNRPLATLDALLPYQRQNLETLQSFASSGRALTSLAPKDSVQAGQTEIDVLSLRQKFANVVPGQGIAIDATFADGTPAAIRSLVGKGAVVSRGYLPSLDYIRKALIAKGDIQKRDQELNENNGIPGPDDVEPLKLNEKSYNPWQYPGDVREHILQPVRSAKIALPVLCSVPLVDAVYMTSGNDIIIPLANYTLQPIKEMSLDIAVKGPVNEVRTVYQGALKYEKLDANTIRVRLPLDCTDFVTVK